MSSGELVDILSGGKRILVFTGAGISTGSGIPDFRGPKGVWKTRQPVYFQDFVASEDARVEYWDQKAGGYEGFRDAQPNAAHKCLVDLETAGVLHALVTQNIDGLHQAAGTSDTKLLEVHGTNRWIECIECGVRSDPAPHVEFFRANKKCPTCEACDGFLKFATISFGQPLKPEVLEAAVKAAATADVVVSLGSTLSVHPAASIPLMAAREGAVYVIINQGPTEHDEIATLRLEGDVTKILPPAVAAVT